MAININAIAELQKEESQLQSKKESLRAEALETINYLVKTFGFRHEEINFGTRTPKKIRVVRKPPVGEDGLLPFRPHRSVPPKYRTEDGTTWTGRGRMPVKMREVVESGVPLESLLIKKDAKETTPPED